jgi:hypothetical protein
MRSRFKKEKLKIALFGIMGHGKSATGNLIAGRECFIVSNDVQTCTKYFLFLENFHKKIILFIFIKLIYIHLNNQKYQNFKNY